MHFTSRLCAATVALVSSLGAAGVAHADQIEITVSSFIDHVDQLAIADGTAQWYNTYDTASGWGDYVGSQVGLWGGYNEPTTISVSVNGVKVVDNYQWTPSWPASSGSTYSSVLTGVIPVITNILSATISYTTDSSSGWATLSTTSNSLTTEILDPAYGAHWYTTDIVLSGTVASATAVPGPIAGAGLLPAFGLGGLGWFNRRRRDPV